MTTVDTAPLTAKAVDWDAAIGRLRRSGFTPIETIKVIRDVLQVGLGEAKQVFGRARPGPTATTSGIGCTTSSSGRRNCWPRTRTSTRTSSTSQKIPAGARPAISARPSSQARRCAGGAWRAGSGNSVRPIGLAARHAIVWQASSRRT